MSWSAQLVAHGVSADARFTPSRAHADSASRLGQAPIPFLDDNLARVEANSIELRSCARHASDALDTIVIHVGQDGPR